ncbi:hypothetical protein T492DRAFT_861290 [Pavlovales sp. CCMP2436]|nr:hypothetical protein T492DRAFT_861290 [Pavlovales sp. CCMP2436]
MRRSKDEPMVALGPAALGTLPLLGPTPTDAVAASVLLEFDAPKHRPAKHRAASPFDEPTAPHSARPAPRPRRKSTGIGDGGSGGGGRSGSALRRPRSSTPARAAAEEGSRGRRPEKEEGGSRQMFDKRTLRRHDAPAFVVAIESWRSSGESEVVAAAAEKRGAQGGGGHGRATLKAFVRKRPLFAAEVAKGEFDVITDDTPSEDVAADPATTAHPPLPPCGLTVHHCLHGADLRSK